MGDIEGHMGIRYELRMREPNISGGFRDVDKPS